MNEANLHGIPAPTNVISRNGLLYAKDFKLGEYHIMNKIKINESVDCLDKNEMAFLLGFHASQITLLTSNLNMSCFNKNDYIDHWSLKNSICKIMDIFGLNFNMTYIDAVKKLEQAAQNLSCFEHVPKTLIDQLRDFQPLKMIEISKGKLERKQRKVRSVIIHNDINPRNFAFGLEKKHVNILASFDYTMSCLGNPAKNIAYTAIDSFNEEFDSTDKLENYIYEIAKGTFVWDVLEKDEIYSVYDEVLSACLKKYSLRWEYWKNEIKGIPRCHNVEFLDPNKFYDLYNYLESSFDVKSLNGKLIDLSKNNYSQNKQIIKIGDFFRSHSYWEQRNETPELIKTTIIQYCNGFLDEYFSKKVLNFN